MSAREFRQRYGRLAGVANTAPASSKRGDAEELPPGARVSQTSFGEIVTFSQTFTDPSATESRMLLDTISDICTDDLIFLDTETTGLAGGTGTFAFLVGLGQFIENEFVVTQYFMRSPEDEQAMLYTLQPVFEKVELLVTYNGRTFDVPLLESRFRLMHRSMPLAFEHLDLLHPSRAIWKHRLANCSLANIESNVLGVERNVDAPGWLIPSIYFDYLHSKRHEPLTPVIEHNRADIYSLAKLTALVLAYESSALEPVDSVDRMSLRLHRLKKFGVESVSSSTHLLWNDRRAPADLRRQVLQELSKHHKRQKNHTSLLADWVEGTRDPSRAIREYCLIELAKYYEHQTQDFDNALAHAELALESARIGRDEDSVREHAYRVNRITRKLGNYQEAVSC